MKKWMLLLGCVAPLVFASSVSANHTDIGREVLAANDGWASYSTGTTGGSAAENSQVFTVRSKQELIEALGGDNATNGSNDTPKIIYVQGTIDINTDENGQKMGPEEYKDPEYDLEAYLDAYDPVTWGYENEVSGPLEEARKRSADNQKRNVVITIGSNTTIIGEGDDARIVGGAFSVKKVNNVIIRNIEFVAPLDYFPGWDPTDGSKGNWNSEYDGLTIEGSTHVWIDHNEFSDGEHPDSASGSYFGREYQQHDGLLDIKNEANYVTVSYNVFNDHDKVTIVGSSDSRTSDREKLKVTFHHNYYKDVSQRLPRVRFGEVHVYNNFYEFNQASEYDFSYAWGVGKESKIYAENNFFSFDYEQDVSRIINDYKGTTIYEEGSFVRTPSGLQRNVDLVEAFNANNEVQLNENVGWKPALYTKIDPTEAVPALVKAKAGTGKIH